MCHVAKRIPEVCTRDLRHHWESVPSKGQRLLGLGAEENIFFFPLLSSKTKWKIRDLGVLVTYLHFSFFYRLLLLPLCFHGHLFLSVSQTDRWRGEFSLCYFETGCFFVTRAPCFVPRFLIRRPGPLDEIDRDKKSMVYHRLLDFYSISTKSRYFQMINIFTEVLMC